MHHICLLSASIYDNPYLLGDASFLVTTPILIVQSESNGFAMIFSPFIKMRKDIGWEPVPDYFTSMKITHIIMTGLTFSQTTQYMAFWKTSKITFGSARIKDW